MKIRKISPREMRRIMQKMGMEVNEVEEVEEVIIVKKQENLRIPSPTVSMIRIGEQTIIQVSGEKIIVEKKEEVAKPLEEIEISDEDAQLVAMQAGVSLDDAKRVLKQVGGDLAKAILTLTASKRDANK
ncbi:MAG: nascent polypeptide-associated complex protein [Candidatus Methanomethylicia archaeon]